MKKQAGISKEVFVEYIKGNAISSICLNTGIMFKNSNRWYLFSNNTQDFWRYHEEGHYVLQTKDENEANWYAFKKLYKEGGDIDEAYRSFGIVLNKFLPKHRQIIKDAAVMVKTLKNTTMKSAVDQSFHTLIFDTGSLGSGSGGITIGSEQTETPVSLGGVKPAHSNPINTLIMGEVKPEILVLHQPGIKQEDVNTGTVLIKDPSNPTGIKQTLNTGNNSGGTGGTKTTTPVAGMDMNQLADKAKENWLVILLIVLLIIALLTRK